MKATTALIWTEDETGRKPQLPEPPPGHFLAWSCVNEAAGMVDYEFAPLPPPPPEPEPDHELPAE